MKPKGAVIFDFDGTIADAEGVMLRVYAPMAERYNWPELTRKNYYLLKKGTPREIMRWANIKIWQLPKLLRDARVEYKKHADEINLFAGMPELVEDLAKERDIYVLSSNDRNTVTRILKNNGLKTRITILHGSPLFGKGKMLKKLLGSKKYRRTDSWMIGDEIRDVEAGKKARINTIGVTWGLQSETGIRKAAPDHIAKKPDDIARFIYNKTRKEEK